MIIYLVQLVGADVFYSETKDEIATIFDVGGHGFGFKNTNIGKLKDMDLIKC